MFKNIYIPVDNSDYSNECVELALEYAKGTEDATIISSHVYAAKMHDVRFRQMESGLPEEYQERLVQVRALIRSLAVRHGSQMSAHWGLEERAQPAEFTMDPVVKDGPSASRPLTDRTVRSCS